MFETEVINPLLGLDKCRTGLLGLVEIFETLPSEEVAEVTVAEVTEILRKDVGEKFEAEETTNPLDDTV